MHSLLQGRTKKGMITGYYYFTSSLHYSSLTQRLIINTYNGLLILGMRKKSHKKTLMRCFNSITIIFYLFKRVSIKSSTTVGSDNVDKSPKASCSLAAILR